MHLDLTIRFYDIVIALGLVIAFASRYQRVPKIEERLDTLCAKFDELTNAISKLEGSFETYKEMNRGR